MNQVKQLFLLVSLSLLMINCNSKKKSQVAPKVTEYTISIDTSKVVSTYNRFMLLGINAGVFYKESDLMNLDFLSHVRALNPGIIRIPGGTWSNELYWNGNRVRISEESYVEGDVWRKTIEEGGNPIDVAFDMSRYKNGEWDVDYTGYAPGFRIHNHEHELSDFHGATDVLFLHKFIQAFGAEAMVTINMGTGTVEMAVEWVKWTKQRENYALEPFDVKYWEMGNELDGHWELGHILADGSKMDAKKYVAKYKIFATAMKEADPTIKVGGSVASNMRLAFIEELIKDLDAPVDFISFHAYPSKKEDTDFVIMANHAAEINESVANIKKWIAKYRPEDTDRIEIALTEWNIKVKEDLTTVDLTNTLWSAVMIGEIAKSGIDIAIQWDLFSTTATGGHGLFNPNDPKMTPRSQYWAAYLWSHFMGDTLIETTLDTPEYVRAFTTVDKGVVSIMIINGSKEDSISIGLNIPKDVISIKEISFSKQQFQLNLESLIPVKSEKPLEKIINIQEDTSVTLAAYSIKIIQYPIY